MSGVKEGRMDEWSEGRKERWMSNGRVFFQKFEESCRI